MDAETFPFRDGAVDFGKDYEYLMSAYYALTFTLKDDIVDFKVSTNNSDMGDFDDVVLEIQLNSGEEHIFALQLKHVERIIRHLNLTADYKKNEKTKNSKNTKFNLKKYSSEFDEIKKNYLKSESYRAPWSNCHFVLYTNQILEKEEEIGDDGLNLEKMVDGSKIKSSITILKYDDKFRKPLLYVCDDSNNHVYNFQTDQEESDFFKQFSFYTNQKTAKEIEALIAKTIFQNFPNCTNTVITSYLNFFKYWCRQDYGACKITKRDIKLKLTELLLVPYIPKPTIRDLDEVPNEKVQQILILLLLFDVIAVDNRSDSTERMIWEIILSEFRKMDFEWEETWPIHVTEVGVTFPKLGREFPISAQTENFSQLTLKRVYLQLWHMGLFPLVLKPCDENVAKILNFCKKQNQKFIIVGDQDFLKNDPSWNVFRTLEDLLKCNEELYELVTKDFELSLQIREWIPLKVLLEHDPQLVKVFDFEDVLKMLKKQLIIGKNFLDLWPEIAMTGFIPKIFLNIKATDELEGDILVISYESDNQDIESRLTHAIQLDQYLLLQHSTSVKNFVPSLLKLSDIKKYRTTQGKVPEKFLILAKGGCSKEEFAKICLINNEKNCHHVRVVDSDRIEWLASHGSLENLRLYRLPNTDFVPDTQVFTYFENKINVICADPGMGKTVMMLSLKFTCPSTHWVILINCRDHVKFFQQKPHIEEVIQYFLDLEGIDYLTKEIVKSFAAKNQLLFLWDGFDELPSDCMEIMVTIVRNLSGKGCLQWITSRNSCKQFLEQSLDLFALTLTQFSTEAQNRYIDRMILAKNLEEQEMQMIKNKVVTNIQLFLDNGYSDHAGIPLQINMMVQIFLDNPKMDRQILTFADIYDGFIQGKFDSMFDKDEIDTENYWMQQILQQYKNSQLPLYEIAALKATLDKDVYDDLKISCEELLQEIEQGEDLVGLIVGIKDKKPVFTHKTYEEFLAASWFVRNIPKRAHLMTVLFQEKYRHVRLMFDTILAKNSPVHYAIIYRNLDMLKKFQDQIATARDNLGRNALQVACTWGRRHPFVPVLTRDTKQEVPTRNFEELRETYFEILQKIWGEKANEALGGILTSPASIETGIERLKQMYDKDDETSQTEQDASTIFICGETITKVLEEDADFLQILKLLLENQVDPLEKDEMFQMNSFEYASKVTSLAAIDVMLQYHQVNIEDLEIFKHFPSFLHYAVTFLYHNLLSTIDDIPYIEYKYSFGRTTLLQMASEVNNHQAMTKLLQSQSYKNVINETNAFGGNPLGSACFLGDKKAVNILLEHGAQPNCLNVSPLNLATVGGSEEIVSLLLEAGADPNIPNLDGVVPLISATWIQNINLVELLLRKGADVNHCHKDYTALDYAIKLPDLNLIQLLIQHGASVNHQNPEFDFAPLHYVASDGNVPILKCLLENGADATVKCKMSYTPLILALLRCQKEAALELIEAAPSVINVGGVDEGTGSLTAMGLAADRNFTDVIQALIEKGGDVEENWNGIPPLHIAVRKGFNESVLLLIQAGASVNRVDMDNKTPLFYAVKHLSTLKILLENSAEVNFRTEKGLTALHFAVFENQIDSVQELLKRGAQVDTPTTKGDTPLTFALEAKNITMVKFLLEQNASVDNGGDLLCTAARLDLPDCIMLLLERGVEVNALDSSCCSALYHAIVYDTSCVKILLERGANPNFIQSNLSTGLLHLSIALNRNEAVKLLIQAVDKVEDLCGSQLALHWATACGNLFSVLILIEAGISVNALDSSDQTPLHTCFHTSDIYDAFSIGDANLDISFNYDNTSCALELLGHGADINAKNKNLATPLHNACNFKHTRLIKLLVQHGADVNVLDNKKQTPLHKVFIVEGYDEGFWLIENGARVDIVDEEGKTPLDYALDHLHSQQVLDLDLLGKLLHFGCNINYLSNQGFTFLHTAVSRGNLDLVTFLLNNGAKTEITTKEGATAVFFAVSARSAEMVSLLIEKTCKLDLSNNNGESPIHLAAIKDEATIIKMLHDQGVDINLRNSTGQTPLELAIVNSAQTSGELLLDLGAQIDVVNAEGKSPFHLAIALKNIRLIEKFIKKKALIDDKALLEATSSKNLDILKLLVSHARDSSFDWGLQLQTTLTNRHATNVDFLSYLLEAGADPNSTSNDSGFTPLQQACLIDDFASVKYLLDHGARVNFPGSDGTTALMKTSNNDSIKIAHYLVERGAIIDQTDYRGWTALFHVCAKNNLLLAKYLHQNGGTISALSNDSSTVLIEGAKHSEIVEYLVSSGSDVNHRNEYNETALYRACSFGNHEGALCLLEHGAVIDIITQPNQLTPLYAAIMYDGNIETVKVLMSFNANVTIRSGCDHTALNIAVKKNKLEILQWMVQELEDPHRSNDYGIFDANFLKREYFKCFCLASSSNMAILTYLCESNLVSITDKEEITLMTPLHYACSNNFYEGALYLINQGADVNAKSWEQVTPLELAISQKNFDLVELLVHHEADLSITDHYGRTPLALAAKMGNLEIVKYLWWRGALVTPVDRAGDTPVHLAAAGGHLEVVQFLTTQNADVALKNENGKTALDLAFDNAKDNVVQYLGVIYTLLKSVASD